MECQPRVWFTLLKWRRLYWVYHLYIWSLVQVPHSRRLLLTSRGVRQFEHLDLQKGKPPKKNAMFLFGLGKIGWNLSRYDPKKLEKKWVKTRHLGAMSGFSVVFCHIFCCEVSHRFAPIFKGKNDRKNWGAYISERQRFLRAEGRLCRHF